MVLTIRMCFLGGRREDIDPRRAQCSGVIVLRQGVGDSCLNSCSDSESLHCSVVFVFLVRWMFRA